MNKSQSRSDCEGSEKQIQKPKKAPLLNLRRKSERFTDWNVGSKYKLEKVMGEGSYGQVSKAIQLTTGKCVAIKRMKKVFDDEEDCKRILRELVILRQIDHPCVAKLIDVLMPGDPASFN